MKIFCKNFSLSKTGNNKQNKITLADLTPGRSGVVKSVGGEGTLRIRLLDMGIIPNTKITVVKVAPMGDPIELYLRGYSLTLRKQDAENIEIEQDQMFSKKGGIDK